MVKDFRLELNSQEAYTIPGEVTGNVVVVTDQAKSYNAIRVTFRGYADVHWTETESETDSNGESRSVTHHYSSHEDYFNTVIVLWNQEQISNRVLNPGHYVFPFRFEFPSGRLPSSFVGSSGHIRYEVEARISTGLFHFDKKVSAIIQVVDRVDINVPALMSPVQYEEEKTICCLCCASPSISLTVNVPRTGFCIGEVIPFTATLDNGSGRIITLIASVNQKVTFRAQQSTRWDTQRLDAIQSRQAAQARSTFQWIPTKQLAIMSAIPTIANCGIISLEYNLRVEAVIPWSRNAVINIPITLGNVPPQSSAGLPPLPPIQYPSLPMNAFVPNDPNPTGYQPPPLYSPPPPGAPYKAPPF